MVATSEIRTIDWSQVQRILAMRLDNIGDVVMLGPALRAIREGAPQAQLTLMASPAGSQAAPLLPWLHEVMVWRVLWQDLGRLDLDPDREWSLITALRQRQFDAAVIFTSFSQTPHAAAWVCKTAGIPLRLSASKETDEALTLEFQSPPDSLHQVERNLRLVESAGFRVRERHLRIHVPRSARQEARQVLLECGYQPGAPYILLNPWTSCQARTYFPERMALAARELARQMGGMAVVAGRQAEREQSEQIMDILGGWGVNCVGATTVPHMAALVADAHLVLTNNTLALHLADALRTPMVVTYSGTDLQSQWEPRRAPAILLRRPTRCSPCYLFTCPSNRECLDVAPAEIVSAGMQLCADLPATVWG